MTKADLIRRIAVLEKVVPGPSMAFAHERLLHEVQTHRAELESRFRVQSLSLTNGTCEAALQPKSTQARKMIPQMKIAFGTNDFSLRATELEFADGSTMRNDFQNPKVNEVFGDDRFQPKLDDDYKMIEPLKGK